MCFDNAKKSEYNGTEEIGLITPTPGRLNQYSVALHISRS